MFGSFCGRVPDRNGCSVESSAMRGADVIRLLRERKGLDCVHGDSYCRIFTRRLSADWRAYRKLEGCCFAGLLRGGASCLDISYARRSKGQAPENMRQRGDSFSRAAFDDDIVL